MGGMPRPAPIDPVIIAALRTVRNGESGVLALDRLNQLVDIGLVRPGPAGYELTFSGRHRLTSMERAGSLAYMPQTAGSS